MSEKPAAEPLAPFLMQSCRAPECPVSLRNSRRAFVGEAGAPCSIHRSRSAATPSHYHKRLTEIYYFLEGKDTRIDGVLHPVRPGMAVLIRPALVTGRGATGAMTILNVVVPPSTHATNGLIVAQSRFPLGAVTK